MSRAAPKTKKKTAAAATGIAVVPTHGKSRPAHLAQFHLSIRNYTEQCEREGRAPDFKDPDAVRQIVQDQSGSSTHHAPRAANRCDDGDPLAHILAESSLCGGGTEPTVFRPDAAHYGVRMWPELFLKDILESLRHMREAWEQGEEASTRPDPLEDLCAPVGRSTAKYAKARPLW